MLLWICVLFLEKLYLHSVNYSTLKFLIISLYIVIYLLISICASSMVVICHFLPFIRLF